VQNIGVIWNRADKSEKNRELEKLDVFGFVPYDKAVFEASMKGKTVFEIEINSPAFLAVQEIIEHKVNLK